MYLEPFGSPVRQSVRFASELLPLELHRMSFGPDQSFPQVVHHIWSGELWSLVQITQCESEKLENVLWPHRVVMRCSQPFPMIRLEIYCIRTNATNGCLWASFRILHTKRFNPDSKMIFLSLQALLSSEPKSSSCSLLKMTMRELTALAMPSADRNTDSSTVPQVWPLHDWTLRSPHLRQDYSDVWECSLPL